MAFADDLMEQTHHLATREKYRPRQASLRLAVSTAYYALFHLLAADTVANWKWADQRADLARVLEHGRMNSASLRVLRLPFPNQNARAVVGLRNVAKAFSRLQQNRHTADYDNARTWTRTEVLELVTMTDESFHNWRAVRAEAVAQNYLLSFLVRDRQ